MPVDLTCANCGKIFPMEEKKLERLNKRKSLSGYFCSNSCRMSYMNKHNISKEKKEVVKRTCLNCGAEFEVEKKYIDALKRNGQENSNARQFCSHKCAVEHREKHRVVVRHKRICKTCGKEFDATRKDANYCSKECSSKRKPYERSVEWRKKKSEEMTKHNPAKTKEARKKMSDTRKGKPHSEEHNKNIGIALKKSEAFHAIFENKEYLKKISEALSGRELSDETKEKIRQADLKRWASYTLDERNKLIEKIMKGNAISPNKPEQALLKVLIDVCTPLNLTPLFVGDGSLVINGRCPDFIIKGSNMLIELFGTYWHKNEDPEERINLFKDSGYRTLIVWENELDDESLLKAKIISFLQ